MSNSSNTDKKYNDFLDYFMDSIWSLIVIILCFIIIAIGFYNDNNDNKSLSVAGSSSFFIFAIYIVIVLYKWKKVEEKQLLEATAIKTAADKAAALAEEEAKAAALVEEKELLEENAICNVNPNLCMHGGKCQSLGSDLQQFRCNCSAGWKGENCNIPDGITIHDSDIDPRCSDKTTGEKNADLTWCNAVINNIPAGCVNKNKYDIECPVNKDGSDNYLYNEFGCDVMNDEVWCPETTEDNIGACVQRAPGIIGELCNVDIIGQTCLDNPDLIWDPDKDECIPNCRDRKVYNHYEGKCVTYDCHEKNEENCSGSYCRWDNNNKKCEIDRSKHQCQSIGKNRCENSDKCQYEFGICYDKDGTDCEYITSNEYCKEHPHCIYNSASGTCKKCDDTPQKCRENINGFKIGGRIKGNKGIKGDGFKLNNGFVVGGLVEI